MFKNLILRVLIVVGLLTTITNYSIAQISIPSGSYIIDMGVNANVKPNGIRPYGLIHELVKFYNVPIIWVVREGKAKDAVDYTIEGNAYKGGLFIIPSNYITSPIQSAITGWRTGSPASGNGYTRGLVTARVLTSAYTFIGAKYDTIKSVPTWTLDAQNGSIAQGFIANAGIPSTGYNYLAPSLLGTCSDIFVMPHADPTWATHGNLYNWNLTYKGAIWLGCHAGSALENMYNPANTSQQTNFLSNKTTTAGTGVILPATGSTAYAQNSLVLWGNHTTATVPYNTNTAISAPQTGTIAAADDWVSQFIGVTDAAHLNGSEQVYLPVKGQSWRSSTKIITYDPTQSNVPSISDGAAVIMAYGNGFGDPNRGQVMLEAGHSINKGTVGDVSAQRAFFNWSYLVVKDKAIKIGAIQGIPQNGNINGITNLSVSANSPVVTSGSLSYFWKAVRADNGAAIGSFSVNNSTLAASTVYNPGTITGSVNILITISVKDPCGRTTTTTVPTTLKQGPTAPVAQNDVAGISADCYTPGGSVTINVLNNDTDIDGDINPNSVLLQNPLNPSAYGTSYTVANVGVWTTNGATVEFTPTTNFFGTATINYKVCDLTSLCASASISVGVGTADSRGCYPGSTWGIQADDTTKTITSNTGFTNASYILGESDYDVADNTTYATIAKSTSNNAVLDFGSTITTTQYDSLRLYWATNVNGNSSSVKLQYSSDNVTYTNLTTVSTSSNDPATETAIAIPASFRYIKISYSAGEVPRIDALTIEKWSCVSAQPDAADDEVSVSEDILANIDVIANDNNPGDLPLTLSIVTAPANGKVSINTNNTITYLNNTDYPTGSSNAADSFVYQICNSQGFCNTAKVRVSITNDVCSAGQYKALNGSSGTVTIQGTNSNMIDNYIKKDRQDENKGTNNPLEVGKNANERRGLFKFNDLSAIPSNAIITSAVFSIYRSGGDATSLNLSAHRITKSWTETGSTWKKTDGTILWTSLGADFNSSAVSSITAVNTTGYKDFDVTSLVQSWVNGTYTNYGLLIKQNATTLVDKQMQFQSSESGTAAQTPKLVISYVVPGVCVTIPNRAPLANPDNATTSTNNAITLNGLTNDVDPDGNTLSVSAVSRVNTSKGAVSLSGNNIIYTPNNSAAIPRTDTLLYTITDGSLTDQAYIFVKVNNAAPVINADNKTDSSGKSQTITVTSNDSDPENNSLTAPVVISDPKNGSYVVSGNNITYTPNSGFYGNDTLIYQRCEASAGGCNETPLCDTALVVFTVLNRPPTVTNKSLQTYICQSKSFSLTENISDPENENLVITILSGTTVGDTTTLANGKLARNSDGSYTYVPNPGWPAANSSANELINYRVTDAGALNSTTATITITVSNPPANANPIAVDDLYNENNLDNVGPVNQNLYIDVLPNDTDPDNNYLKIQLTSYPSGPSLQQPRHGSISVFNSQVLYVPDFNYIGVDTFEYVLYDSFAPVASGCAAPVRAYDIGMATLLIKPSTTYINLSGTVWYDVNASANGTFSNIQDGAEVGTNTNDDIYVFAIDELGNIVDKALVDNDGSYIMYNVPAIATGLTLKLSNTNASIGSTPPASTLPLGWRNTTPFVTDVFNTTGIFITAKDWGLNKVPLAVNDSISSNEDVPVSGDVTSNDTPSGDGGNTWSLVNSNGGANRGTVNMNTDGTFTYSPELNYNGIDSFEYRVCDVNNDCAYAHVYINITPVNDPPVVPDTTVTIPEDSVITVCLPVADVDGVSITPSACGGPSNGTINSWSVEGNSVCITYTPNKDYNGMDTLCVVVCDNGTPNKCDTGHVYINITPVNDPPVIPDTTVTIPEDSVITVCLPVADVDGVSITPSECGGPSNGTINSWSVDGNSVCITYTPNKNYNGKDTLCVVVCDNGTPNKCDTGHVYINITPVNDPPVIPDTKVTIPEDSVITVCLPVTDVDGVSITPSECGGPSNGTINSWSVDGNSVCITYTPNKNYNGKDTLCVVVCDNGTPNKCDTGHVYINITPVNDPPVIPDTTVTIPEDSVITVCLPVTDVDGVSITPSECGGPSNGTINSWSVDGNSVCITYTPNKNYNGKDTLCVVVCDNGTPNKCDTAHVYINIIPVNDPPVLPDTTVTIPEDSVITVCLPVADVDGVSITPSECGGPSNGTINSWSVDGNSVCITYTPNKDYNGKDELCVVVCDNGTPNKCDTAHVYINIIPVNDPPVLPDTTVTIPEDSVITVCLPVADVDGVSITPSECGGPSNGTINSWSVEGNSVCITYTPNKDYNGKDELCVLVCDNGTPNQCDTAHVYINITPVNDPPVVPDTTVTIPEDSVITVCLPVADVDGVSITPSECGGPSNGTINSWSVEGNSVCITYTPNKNYNGKDTLCVVVCDNGTPNQCDTAHVYINIISVNDLPVALNDSTTTNQGVAVSGSVDTNDTLSGDGGNVWSLVGIQGNANHGTVLFNSDGSYTYTPQSTFSGIDTFYYKLCDIDNDCSTAIVIIKVLCSTPAAPELNITQPTCLVSTGTIVVTSPLGVQYLYSKNGTEYQDSGTFVSVASGSYNITVKNGACISSSTTAVVNAQPATPAAPTVSLTQPTCVVATGTITITAPTGAGYTYSINGSTYTNTTGVFSGVASGSYNVTAKNADGCISSPTSSTINAQPATPAAPTVSLTQPTCAVATGTITITAPIGTGFTYSTNGSTYTNTTGVFSGLASGTYSVIAKNAAGCISLATSATINAQPATPAAPAVSLTQPTCALATGTITITAPIGTGFTYSTNGSTYTNTTGVFSGLASGTYSVTAKNAAGCISAPTSATINAQPATPAAPTVSLTQPTCALATGTITITAPIGTGFTYSTNGSTYTNTTGVFSGLAAGAYSVTAKNAAGCISSPTSATINAQPAKPAAPTVSLTQPTCALTTGTITITAPTGTGFTYSTNGSTYTNTTGVFSGLAAGTYSVTAKNAAGCISLATSATINAQPAKPAAPSVSLTQPTCALATGTITITAPIGTGYTYSTNGSTYTNTTGIFSGLAAGTYSVTAKNAAGCISLATSAIINAQPAKPAAPTVSITQPTCALATGTITITAPTGTGFTYSTNGSTYTNTTGVFTGVAVGTYSVTAKNAAGCISLATNAVLTAATNCVTVTSGIYHTNVTCSNFKTSPSTSLIGTMCYASVSKKISNVTPGQLFYYSSIKAPSSSFCIDIKQTRTFTGFGLFEINQANQVTLWDPNCTKVASGTQVTVGVGRICITNAVAGTNYVLSVKYDSKTIIGGVYTSGTAPTSVYTFESSINGLVVAGSKASVNLAPGCVASTPLTRTSTTSNGDLNIETAIRTYPNPFTDKVNFEITPSVSGNAVIELYDIMGRKLTTVYNGKVVKGIVKLLPVYLNNIKQQVVIYKATIGNQTFSGKLLPGDKE